MNAIADYLFSPPPSVNNKRGKTGRYEIEEGGSERKHILYVRQSYSKHKRLPQSVNYDGGGKDVRKRDLGEEILNTEKV